MSLVSKVQRHYPEGASATNVLPIMAVVYDTLFYYHLVECDVVNNCMNVGYRGVDIM